MKEINLRDYYPYYKEDTFVEVPDEVASLLREYSLLEEAYRIRVLRHKAYYSLDFEGHMERDIASSDLSPYEALEKRCMSELLYKAMATLTEKQRQRIYAFYFLGMSKRDIARAEGKAESSIKESIQRGLLSLEKYFKENG